MNNVLLITLIGGGMVFAGLILLWLMMALLVQTTTQKTKKTIPSEQTLEEKDSDLECKQKAAAAAVCAAMSFLNSSFSISSHKENQVISPWQNLHRNIQINQSNTLPHRKNE